MITEKTQHVIEAVSWLLCQSKGQPRIEALLTSYIAQIQVIENVSYDYFLETFLTTAEGAQLDRLGAIVGCERGTLVDVIYRAMIAVRVLVNQSSLSFTDISEILHRWLDISGYVGNLDIVESYPAHIDILVDDDIFGQDAFTAVCYLVKPGGVSLTIQGGGSAYLLHCKSVFEEALDYDHLAAPFAEHLYLEGGLAASII